MDLLDAIIQAVTPRNIEPEKYKQENCDLCHKFMASDRINTNFCDRCTEILDGEQREAELGIGRGSIFYPDNEICRHGIEK